MTDLKLLAVDNEDLDIVSAHIQDAVVRVGDMGYAKTDRRFVMLMNRYAWEAGDSRGRGQRKRAGLHFDYVSNAHAEGIDLNAKDALRTLESIHHVTIDLGSTSIDRTSTPSPEQASIHAALKAEATPNLRA